MHLHAMLLAHNTTTMVDDALNNFQRTTIIEPVSRTIVDARYPKVKSEWTQAHKLMDLAQEYGWDYVRPSINRGVGGNWDWCVKELGLGDEDILLGVDPDGRPVQKGYDAAILDVFEHDHSAYTVQLNVAGTYAMQLTKEEMKLGETWAIHYRQPCAWTMGAFSVKWLKQSGGFLQAHPYYGYVELEMAKKLQPMGARSLILRDFYDEHLKAEDPEYTQWKLECAQYKTMLPFSEWLKRGI